MRSIFLLLAVASCWPARAGETPHYQRLGFRDNDPFVFCTQGLKDNPRAWSPEQPARALWRLTPGYCPVPSTGTCPIYPYTYKRWSNKDVNALSQYLSTCPHGEREGRWRGQGKPENAPYAH